jgi:hypothetical protein
MPIQSVGKYLQKSCSTVLIYGHGRDIPHAASVKVTGGDVMAGMTSPPIVEGRECQDTEKVTDISVPAW